MKLVELTLKERENIYNKHMLNDFNKSEVKPFNMIERLIKTGNYMCCGFYKESRPDELLGYAYFVKTKYNILMDYLAVSKDYRGNGYGSKFLTIIYEKFKTEFNTLLAEVENPRFSIDDEDKKCREGRITFYLKNNFNISNIETCVLKDQYKIIQLELNKSLEDIEIEEEMKSIYNIIFDSEFYEKHITVNN